MPSRFLYIVLLLFAFALQTPHTALCMSPDMEGDLSKQEVLEDISDDSAGFLDTFKKRIRQIWHSGTYDLYIPVNTWHNRLAYDSRVSRYNEMPWGGGLGKSFKDEDGDRHYLFLMGFQDSHYMFQPYGGYAFLKKKYFDEKEDFSVGAGIVLGITARQEYDYVPLPLPLPIVGIQYKTTGA